MLLGLIDFARVRSGWSAFGFYVCWLILSMLIGMLLVAAVTVALASTPQSEQAPRPAAAMESERSARGPMS